MEFDPDFDDPMDESMYDREPEPESPIQDYLDRGVRPGDFR